MSIAELGQYFYAITHAKKISKIQQEERGEIPLPSSYSANYLCVQQRYRHNHIICQDCAVVLNYFVRHSYDTVITVYSSIVKIRYYSTVVNSILFIGFRDCMAYISLQGASIRNRILCFFNLKM